MPTPPSARPVKPCPTSGAREKYSGCVELTLSSTTPTVRLRPVDVYSFSQHATTPQPACPVTCVTDSDGAKAKGSCALPPTVPTKCEFPPPRELARNEIMSTWRPAMIWISDKSAHVLALSFASRLRGGSGGESELTSVPWPEWSEGAEEGHGSHVRVIVSTPHPLAGQSAVHVALPSGSCV
eukprot:5674882-Pleurochrysis_carterae.AAC.1